MQEEEATYPLSMSAAEVARQHQQQRDRQWVSETIAAAQGHINWVVWCIDTAYPHLPADAKLERLPKATRELAMALQDVKMTLRQASVKEAKALALQLVLRVVADLPISQPLMSVISCDGGHGPTGEELVVETHQFLVLDAQTAGVFAATLGFPVAADALATEFPSALPLPQAIAALTRLTGRQWTLRDPPGQVYPDQQEAK